MHDPRGSIWRKWDLHLHTPASYDYPKKDISNEEIIEALKCENIHVAAITDHHTMDVTKIKELQEICQGSITILPGIELRSELGGTPAVHFIGVFPENCDLDEIWKQIEVRCKITAKDIEKAGGPERIYVDFTDCAVVVHELGGIVIAHAGRKSNSIEEISNAEEFKQNVKENLINNHIDVLEVGRKEQVKDYEEIVFKDRHVTKKLPLVTTSDNHDARNYTLKEACWLKADPCFAGLKHVIQERHRVYIGEIPTEMERVESHSMKYLRSVEIHKVEGSDLADKWFDCSISLNSGLIAVIGRKGSGKSALTDIIGLVAASGAQPYFSFLNKSKFKNLRANKAKHFRGRIEWWSGDDDEINLDADIPQGAVEKVKYIPQNYLEEICSGLGNDERTSFDYELEEVVFSHIKKADRLGLNSLLSLIEAKTASIESAITRTRTSLVDVNDEIAEKELQLEGEYKDNLLNQKDEKLKELIAHKKRFPQVVVDPRNEDNDDDEAQTSLSKRIDDLRAVIIRWQEMQSNSEASIEDTFIQFTTMATLKSALTDFQGEYEDLSKELKSGFEKLGLDINKTFTLKIDYTELMELAEVTEGHAEKHSGIVKKAERRLIKLIGILSVLEDKLDKPSKLFREYQDQKQDWSIRLEEIRGTKEDAGSFLFIYYKIKDLNDIPASIEVLKRKRTALVDEIFSGLSKICEVYADLYKPVQDFIDGNPLESEGFDLKLQVWKGITGFEVNFFEFISQLPSSSFCGIYEGSAVLRRLLDSYDSNSLEQIHSLLIDIDEHLRSDKRTGAGFKTSPTKLLKKGRELARFYDFLFSLEWLKPRFELTWQGKRLEQLSPGEKGTILLVFFLLIDQSNIPLIIDQPEENLDNETVYKILVESFVRAKDRRQVIIVTHNPNLAVVCDADQIVHASIDAADGYKISYKSGALENLLIAKAVIDILEGTEPAFSNRELKYKVADLLK